MTDQNSGQLDAEPPQHNVEPPPPPPTAEAPPPPPPTTDAPPPPPQHMQPYSGGDLPYRPPGPPGQIRSTGMCMLLFIVTLGIYSWYWWFKVHEETKRHTGEGIGGGIALILAIFLSIVMPFITSSEVGTMYEREGRTKPVSGLTGLWYFPGMIIIVGPIVWFVKTNGALNDYWQSKGAVAS